MCNKKLYRETTFSNYVILGFLFCVLLFERSIHTDHSYEIIIRYNTIISLYYYYNDIIYNIVPNI